MNFKITQELAQQILDYLIGRPYKEVFPLIDGLRAVERIEDVKVEEPVVEEAMSGG